MGNRVFAGTLDAALVALDRTSGLLLWETQVADTMSGYSITQSPLIVKDKIIVGVAGGEFGIRGFIDAYDLETGKRLWRFNTIPGPGEFGNDTWKGDSWMRGGGSTWLTGTYDAELDTLYWPVGNPGPDIDGSGGVDGHDLGILLAAWGGCTDACASPSDLNADGEIDGADLALLLSAWTAG